MMNGSMLKTEIYKIFSKRVIWISMAVFLTLYLVLKLQFWDNVSIRYTLEPMCPQLTEAVENPAFHEFVRKSSYNCSTEEMRAFVPKPVYEYIEQYRGNERIYRSLNSDLAGILNNYFERIDQREAFIQELAQKVSGSGGTALDRAKARLLQAYRETPVPIELNLEDSANNFIDVNHAALFPGLIMLLVIAGLAGIYSDEYTSGTQSALLTSRQGRRGVFLSKAIAAGIFVAGVVLVTEAFFMVVTAVCYRVPSSTVSAASTYGLSLTLYGGSVYGFCLRQVLGTLLAGLTLGSIVMCISVFSKSALIPFFAAGAYYGGTAIYANSVPFPRYLSSLWSLPGEWSLFMLQTQFELVEAGRYTSIFGLLVPTLATNAVFNLLLMAACLGICYWGYTGKQVRG